MLRASSCAGATVTFIHLSFIVIPPFPQGRLTRTASLGGDEIPHGQQQPQTVFLAPLQDGTKESRRQVTAPGPWMTCGPLSCG